MPSPRPEVWHSGSMKLAWLGGLSSRARTSSAGAVLCGVACAVYLSRASIALALAALVGAAGFALDAWCQARMIPDSPYSRSRPERLAVITYWTGLVISIWWGMEIVFWWNERVGSLGDGPRPGFGADQRMPFVFPHPKPDPVDWVLLIVQVVTILGAAAALSRFGRLHPRERLQGVLGLVFGLFSTVAWIAHWVI